MELWWDGTQKKLKVVIAAGENNIEPYKQAFSIMYPDAQFNKLKNTVPDWWDERYPYHYFDVSLAARSFCRNSNGCQMVYDSSCKCDTNQPIRVGAGSMVYKGPVGKHDVICECIRERKGTQ